MHWLDRRLEFLVGGLLLLAALIASGSHAPVRAQSTGPRAATRPADSSVVAIDSLPARAASVSGAQVSSFAAGQSTYRPYRQEPSVYLSASAVRYNRVEGPVVGLQRDPLSWRQSPPIAPFGQVGYALGLGAWRAVAGLEARLVSPRGNGSGYGLKVGAHAAHTTATEDDWKRSWEDNSVSALLFGDDLFNYYEMRGVTAYVAQRLSRQLRVTIGARWAQHNDLPRTTAWTLFGSNHSRANPPIDAGEIRTVIGTVEGGHLTRWTDERSVGTIARAHVELGRGFGAPLSYNRYLLDVQTYQAITESTNLNLRGRAGLTSPEAPVQMQFRLDGVRGLRTFDPAARAAERMLLGSAEWVWHNAPRTTWSGPTRSQIFGDLGWIGDDRPPGGDTFTFVGMGASTFDRVLSVELAWPLHATPNWTRSHWRPQIRLKVNPLR